MKKNYTKPEIKFDSFELSTSIAANCVVVTNQAPRTCPVDLPEFGPGVTLFTTQCTDGGVGNDGVCYHVAPDDSVLFTS